jgi:alpha-galactosidase
VSRITFDESTATWLLETPSTAYGLCLSGERRLPRHLHWGRGVDHETLGAFGAAGDTVRHGDRISWADETPLEYVAWGGRRFDEPSLKVDFGDGMRVVEWALTDQHVEDEGDGAVSLVLQLDDVAYPLRAELCYRVFEDSDVIERWARLANRAGNGSLVVRQAHSANWWLPWRPGWRLGFLHGAWSHETQLARQVLESEKIVLESRRGTTSHEFQPFFALQAAGAGGAGGGQLGEVWGEERGEVWSGQVAWSGSWKIVCEQTAGGHVHVSGGWNDFDAPIEVEAGNELALPVFAGLYSSDGLGAMSRAWHDYELGHVLSRPWRRGRSPSFPAPTHGHEPAAMPAVPEPAPAVGAGGSLPPLRPVLYNSWEATAFEVSEEGQARLAELAAGLGVELFVVDDGWFAGRRDDRAGLGDWTVDSDKFPAGLAPLIERVKKLGMGFGIWVEPEMVNPDSDLYRAHPDWVYHFPGRTRSEQRNQLVLNLARDDVAEWLYGTIDRLLAEHDIDFLKWDMNRHISEPGWPEQFGSNPERAWIGHTANLYAILERLHASHPRVEIESCSGGAGRVDLGILSRTAQVWTSDNTDAWDRIAIQEGFSFAHAPLAMMAWVTDSPNPLTKRRLPLRYRFHVAMAGSLGIGGNLNEWSDEELATATELIRQYKAIRHVVQHGRLHRIASTRGGPLGAVAYVSRDGEEAVVLAWSGVRRFGPLPRYLRLAGLERGARYRDSATGEERPGAALADLGLRLPNDLDFASMLVHLRRVR